MGHLEPQRHLHRFSGQVMGAAHAGGSVVDGAWLGFDQRHELGKVVDRHLRIDGQVQSGAACQGHRQKIFFVVVGQVFVDGRVHGEHRTVGYQKRVAVFGRRLNDLRRHHTIRTRLVVNHHRLTEALAQALGVNPRDGVRESASRVRHHQFDGFVRIGTLG